MAFTSVPFRFDKYRKHRQECLCHLEDRKKRNEYEGKSHDITDNRGPIFLSHDVYDK
jgi:hypothetical protein